MTDFIIPIILYTLRFVFIAFCLGIFFSHLNIFKCFNIVINFMMGVCLSLFVTVSLNYIMGFIWPGYPIALMWFLCPLTACLALMLSKPKITVEKLVCFIQENTKTLFAKNKKTVISVVIIIAVALFFILRLLTGAYYQMRAPIYASDLSHYMVQARFFAEDRASFEIDNYTGDKQGTVLKDDHGAYWPVFLADGWSFSPTGEFTYETDINVRYSILAVFIVFLVTLIFVIYAVTKNIFLSLLAPCVFYIYNYSYLILGGSRDGFRFIPLLAIFLFCLDLIMRAKQAKVKDKAFTPRKLDYLALATLVYFSTQGHGGNIFILIGFAVVLLCFFILYRVPTGKIVLMASSALVGLLLVFTKNLQIYLTYGTFRTSTAHITENTIMEQSAVETGIQRTTWDSITQLLTPYSVLFFVIGLIVIFVLLILYCVKCRGNKLRLLKLPPFHLEFILLSLSVFLPLTGIYNLSGSDVFTWFVIQVRYRMVFYLIITVVVLYAFRILKENLSANVFAGITSVFSILVFVFALINNPNDVIGSRNTVENNSLNANELIQANEFAHSMSDEGSVVCADQITTYYFKTPAKYLITPFCKPLIQAKTETDIEEAIKTTNLKVLVVNYAQLYSSPHLLPLYDYLEANATVYNFNDVLNIGVFVLQ